MALDRIRERSPLYRLGGAQVTYIKEWYYQVIRELACDVDWHGDFKVLGEMMRPAISASKARDAVDLLYFNKVNLFRFYKFPHFTTSFGKKKKYTCLLQIDTICFKYAFVNNCLSVCILGVNGTEVALLFFLPSHDL